MKCKRCGSEMKDGWAFCPRCGSRKNASPMDTIGRDLFSQVFEKMKRSFSDIEGMNKRFDKDIEALDLSPWFRKMQPESSGKRPPSGVQKKGFAIRITSGKGKPPKVSIKTFGGSGNKPKVYTGPGPVPAGGAMGKMEKSEKKVPSSPFLASKKAPKVTEEPAADVKRIGERVVVDIKMPGVLSEEDIEVRDLESSVEVKALAGEKAYFKILTKPPQFRLNKKSFEDGVLHMEFS